MRSVIYVLTTLAVVALGFWAYRENYATQTAIREVRALHNELGATHQRLRLLHAEWAYLNRPDRLRELTELNYERLALLPISPDAFGQVHDVALPPQPVPVPVIPDFDAPIINPIEVINTDEPL